MTLEKAAMLKLEVIKASKESNYNLPSMFDNSTDILEKKSESSSNKKTP